MIAYIDKREADKRYAKKIQALEEKLNKAFPWQKGKIKAQIKALEEGQRDILTPSVTQAQTTQSVVDKNNYGTYAKQIQETYEMYNNRTDYGGELLGALVETRQALIAGEGISIKVDGNETANKWHQDLIEYNKLDGTNLMEMVQIGEMEGRDLIFLFPDKKDNNVKIRSVAWRNKPYTVYFDELDYWLMNKTTVVDTVTGEEKILTRKENSVFVRLGGSVDRMNETTNRIHRVLTQIENFSRANYDLRKNSHLFGKIAPYWKTETAKEAKSINNELAEGDFDIGDGYAGTADFSFVAPPSNGLEILIKDMLSNLKIIATMTGIPIHWLSWPELMSNRATADNIHESLILATKKERLIWEESLEEMFKKAQIIAVDKLGAPNDIISDVHVNLPIISIAVLKEVAEIWVNLWQLELIDKYTVQNKIPGIDIDQVNKGLEEEKQKAIEDSVMNNRTVNDTLNGTEEEDD